jgi:hypothetical protein
MSRLLVSYEWEWVVSDDAGDIVEVDYADPGGLCVMPGMTLHALVKNYGNEVDGIQDRSWAYVEDGLLGATFDDGSRVPAKLMAEFAKVMGAE